MSALQHWLASTFAHLAQAFAWPVWGLVAGGMILILYFKAMEASD